MSAPTGLLLVTGPPGSGRSTVTAALAELWEPSVLVEGDAFFAFLRRGAISPWLPGVVEAIRAAVASGRTRYAVTGSPA
ncbi:MAG TPA: hypothetical protein VKY86_05715 [Promicromonospora sp.]|nr:hypothetical protein [Promicromonospora sp.]